VCIHLVHLVRVRRSQHTAAAALGAQDVLGVRELLVADDRHGVHRGRKREGMRSCPAICWPGPGRSPAAARPWRARSASRAARGPAPPGRGSAAAAA
jgi:hypothetical protein